ncbi:helix-turn-helix transcriptional regulator [soil metagenome]
MKKIPVRQLTEKQKLPASSERFKIRTVQEILAGNDLKQDLHRHDFFFMLFLQKGSGKHEIDFTDYQVHDNSIFFLRPGQVHQLELKAGSSGYLVEFNNEFYHPNDKLSSQRLRSASNKNYCKLEVTRFKKLQDILSYIFQEYTSREENYLDVIKANLKIFFIEFIRQRLNPKSIPGNVSSYTQARFEEFLEHLDKHLTTHKQVSQYTSLMNLSTYQLNEITKATVGKTASEIINQQVILEAKRYLLATPNQVKDIADHLGYEDVSYFIRFFKKHTGESPEAFRHNFK